MKLELKNLKHSKSLSRETPAYTARVYLDGKPFCEVENDGHGGCDMVYPLGNHTNADIVALENRIAAEFPPYDLGEGLGPIVMDLELWCHLEIDNIATRKLLDKNIVFKANDGRIFAVKKTDGAREALLKRRPDVLIINDLPFAEAAKML